MSQSETKAVAFFPFEVLEAMEELKVGGREARNNDFFFPVTFQGSRCRIQTPELLVMFGLTTHCNPDSGTNPIPKYSLHLSLKPVNEDIVIFREWLAKMDEFAMGYKLGNEQYWSSVRPAQDAKKSDLLRLKMPLTNNHKRLILDIIDTKGRIHTLPTIQTFKELVKHGCKVKCIIEVNPIWYAGKKYGISYRILKLAIVKDNYDEAYSVQFQ